jgi:hypothetical protein
MHVLLLLVSLVLQSPASAVDFSGTWKMIPEKSGSPEQSQPITQMTFVIEQTARDIKLDMTTGHDQPVSVTYPLVPTPKLPEDALPSGEQRAFWQGNKLTVERGVIISGQTVSSKQVLSLNPDRSEMTVERLVIVQHGYTLKGTPNYATVTDVFARVPR